MKELITLFTYGMSHEDLMFFGIVGTFCAVGSVIFFGLVAKLFKAEMEAMRNDR